MEGVLAGVGCDVAACMRVLGSEFARRFSSGLWSVPCSMVCGESGGRAGHTIRGTCALALRDSSRSSYAASSFATELNAFPAERCHGLISTLSLSRARLRSSTELPYSGLDFCRITCTVSETESDLLVLPILVSFSDMHRPGSTVLYKLSQGVRLTLRCRLGLPHEP